MIADRSLFDPLEPMTSSRPSSPVAMDGACMLVSREPGGMCLPAARSSSPIMLFRWRPVPGTITPEWHPFDAVNAHAFPARSTDRDVGGPASDGTTTAAVG